MGTRQRREGRGIIAPKRIIGPPGKTSPGKNSSMAINSMLGVFFASVGQSAI